MDQNFLRTKPILEKLFNNICTCKQYNRNTNAFNHETEGEIEQPQQLYPHMRKLYNDDTSLLEYVYIIMSTVKPDEPIAKPKEEPVIQKHHRRHTRISKQRAKVLITEYCTRKIGDNLKIHSNLRNYPLSLLLC